MADVAVPAVKSSQSIASRHELVAAGAKSLPVRASTPMVPQ
jgi:hypothetical protein